MSIKWYQQHLEDVIRENETLKQNKRKQADAQIIISCIHRTFVQLFPNIPSLIPNHYSLTAIQQMLAYYQKTASKWIEMLQSKLLIYQSINSFTNSKQQPYTQVTNQPGDDSLITKDRYLLYGHQKDEREYENLKNKITQLQKMNESLKLEITRLERQQEKYLKEISYLRSITKQMEFELAQEMLTHQKTQKAINTEHHENLTQISQLRKQVQIWKDEYDRIWKEQIKKERATGHYSSFSEERAILNNLCKEEKDYIESSSQNSNIWIIRSNYLEQSEIIEESNKDLEPQTTSRQ